MAQSLDKLILQGEGAQDAVPLGDGIFLSRGVANTYVVTSAEGDLLINTGLHFEAEEIRARFARVSNNPLQAGGCVKSEDSMSEPRIEIVATLPGTLWEATGVHHLGYWSDDVDHDVVLLAAAGMAVEAKGRDRFGTVLWAYCKGPSGIRIELVSRSLEPILSELFAKGRLNDVEGIDT